MQLCEMYRAEKVKIAFILIHLSDMRRSEGLRGVKKKQEEKGYEEFDLQSDICLCL